MALAPDQFNKVLNHIRTKWRASECALCGSNNWEAHGHVTLALTDAPGVMVVGAPSLPCVALVCQTCGNTVLINMVVVGAVR